MPNLKEHSIQTDLSASEVKEKVMKLLNSGGANILIRVSSGEKHLSKETLTKGMSALELSFSFVPDEENEIANAIGSEASKLLRPLIPDLIKASFGEVVKSGFLSTPECTCGNCEENADETAQAEEESKGATKH